MEKFPFTLLALACLVGAVTAQLNVDDNYVEEYDDMIELSNAERKFRDDALKTLFSNLENGIPDTKVDEDFEETDNDGHVKDNDEDAGNQLIDKDVLDISVINTNEKLINDDIMNKENLMNAELKSPYDKNDRKTSFDETLGDVEAGNIIGISYNDDAYDKIKDDQITQEQKQILEEVINSLEPISDEEIRQIPAKEDVKEMLDDGNDVENEDLNKINSDTEIFYNENKNSRDGEDGVKGMFDKDDSEESEYDYHYQNNVESEIADKILIDANAKTSDSHSKNFNDVIDDSYDETDDESEDNSNSILNEQVELNDQNEDSEVAEEIRDFPENDINEQIRTQMLANEFNHIEKATDDKSKESVIDDENENINTGDDEMRNAEYNDLLEALANEINKSMFDDDIDNIEEVHDVNGNIGDDEIVNNNEEVKDFQDAPVNDNVVKGMFDDDDTIKSVFNEDINNVEEIDENDDTNDNIGDDEKLNIGDEIDNIEDDLPDESDESMYDDEEETNNSDQMLNLDEEISNVVNKIEEEKANFKNEFGYQYVDDNEEAVANENNESDENFNEVGEVGDASLFKIVDDISQKILGDEETIEEPAYNVDSIPAESTDSINSKLALNRNVGDTEENPELTSTATESPIEETIHFVELSPDTKITLVSPGYPEPYQNNFTLEWQLTGDTGKGIEINVTMTDLDGGSDDYLLIKPGHLNSNTDSVLFTFNIDEELRYRFHDFNEAYIKFVSTAKSTVNQQYQGFSLSAKFIEKVEEEAPPTEVPAPYPVETHRVFLGGTSPFHFLNISEDFRLILVDMVTLYINENGIDAGSVPVNDILQITSVTSCQLTWPNNDNCVAVRYGVSFVYNETFYSSAEGRIPEMSEESLNKMWSVYSGQDPFAARMERLGVWDFVAPDDAAVLTLWLLISGGVVMVMVLLSYAIWRWNCFEEYTAMSRYSDTESVMSKKSDASLYPTPHQNLPPMFAAPRDSLWSDQAPPKYEDARFPEPGRSYDNRSFVRDGEFFDLESDEEIVMSLPDGPGAKYQMKYPQRFNKDAEA